MKQIIGIILIAIPILAVLIFFWYHGIKIAINDGDYEILILASAITFLPLGAILLIN